MNQFVLFLIFILSSGPLFAKDKGVKVTLLSQFVRVEAEPSRGFYFPFFLFIPESSGREQSLLILPNNSGIHTNDVDVQIAAAKKEALVWRDLAEALSAVLLVPVFPRPAGEPTIYTHSLSRSTLEVKDGPLKRIDLQLIQMSERARVVVKELSGRTLRKKFLLFGFSASAMFVNRFVFIHPERVSAIAFGAPGGWPLAPVTEFRGESLRFPIGISDLKNLVRRDVDVAALRKVPFFVFLGANDENDSVIFRDGYTDSDQDLVFKLFGKKPVDRWPVAERIYKDAGLTVQFKLYQGLGHETNKVVHDDIIQFFRKAQ